MTKAKYYVEWWSVSHGWTGDKFPDVMGYATEDRAVNVVEVEWLGRRKCGLVPWRIRHKGRTIARWQDGRMVK